MGNSVDFHCHLDLYPDLEHAVDDAERAGVYTLTVTTTPRAWPRNLQLTRQTRFVRCALGLHPQLVAERAHELPIWERYLPEARYVGEVGLDAGPRFYRSFEQQKQVFNRVLQCCAEAGNKILTVHSVRAAKAVLDSIEAHLPADRSKVVLHWFTGSVAEARRAVELGCYFSINTEMARTDRGRAVIASLPIERLLTETDGPFTRQLGRPACPADAFLAVEAVAALRGLAASDMAKTVLANLRSLTTGATGRGPLPEGDSSI